MRATPVDRTVSEVRELARRPVVLDGALAIGLTVAFVGITASIEPSDGERALDLLAYALIVVACGVLAVRRRLPVTALLVASVATSLYSARDYAGGPVYLTALFAMYTVASTRDWRRSAPLVAGAMLIHVAGGLASSFGYVGWVVIYSGWAAAAVFLGDAARNRRQYLASLEERARRLEATQEEEARRRVAEERLRIAGDLHDVVSHTLGAITVQAGVGAHVIERDPAQAKAALEAIKEAGQEAMGELRVILGLLREEGGDEDGSRRSPTPGIDRLGSLVAGVRRAGIPVDLVTTGHEHPLPAATELAAYRIVQESLTNVVRHADASQATVTLGYADDGLTIEVTDDGRASHVHDRVGHGITGMVERAAALGGSLHAGPRATGGFVVRAHLPCGVP
jgi:signal transduction histidine kinase